MILNNLSLKSSQSQERIKILKKDLILNNRKMKNSRSDNNLTHNLINNNKITFEINGVKQYLKALKGIEKKKKFIETEKEKLKILEFKELREIPKINRKSILLTRCRSMDGLKIEERLIKKGKELEKKKLNKMKQLSFDFGNKKSKLKQCLNKSSTKQYIETLYNNANERREQRKQLIDNYNKNFNFKPKISKRAHDLSKEKYQLILKKEKEKVKKIKDLIIQENNSKYFIFKDEKNINRKKLINTYENNNNTNYTKEVYSKELTRNICELNEEKSNNTLKQKTQWLSHINKIILKTKNENYKKLFSMVGGLNGNLLKKDIILPKQNIKFINEITNLLNEIKKENKEIISFKEFCIKAEKYLSK